MLESAYEAVLEYELTNRGMEVVRQVSIPLIYRGLELGQGFTADLIVNDKVIIELKSIEAVQQVHKKQLLTYLRLSDKRLGLLLNFGQALFKDGVNRIVNGLQD